MREYISIGVFVLVYFLIVTRRRFHIPIWTSMVIGAVLMVGLGVISIGDAIRSINLNVIAFLFGMFSIVTGLEKSGVLRLVAIKMLSKAKSPNSLLLIFVVGMGLLSAFLVNDTIALLGIPLVIYISKYLPFKPVVLLIALAFGISIGSTMTPIGNPQNLLIAVQSGISLPFTTFIIKLGVPTVVNLFLTYFILRIYFRKDLLPFSSLTPLSQQPPREDYGTDVMTSPATRSSTVDPKDAATSAARAVIENPRLAKVSIVVLLVTIGGFISSELTHFFFHIVDLGLSVIAMMGATALYVLVGGDNRGEILKSVNYSVLVFFIAMFIFTSALWSSGAISLLVLSHMPTPHPNPAENIYQNNAIISAASIILSQVLSNVPFVAIYNLVMTNNGFAGDVHTSQWMMLAAASTVAGNLTILGAASNIIIIEAAEARGIRAFSFLEFFKVGVLVTIVNVMIYYLFILII